MSEHVTLVQLADNLGIFCHTVKINSVWIFDTNYKISLTLVLKYLGYIYTVSNNYDIDV